MITIIDYDAGNLTSVYRALKHIGVSARISDNPKEIESAQKIIFPGVGHAKSAMQSLKQKGVDAALKNAFDKKIPILGICLGTQIILSHSQEGDTQTLGFIDGNCVKFDADLSIKIPHIGWNNIEISQKHFILKDLNPQSEMYFVHSYYPVPANGKNVYATCEHGIKFACAVGYENLFAVQFHPEKSGEDGLKILKNFSLWNGE